MIEKIKAVVGTIIMIVLAVLTFGAVTQAKREARKKAIKERDETLDLIEKNINESEKQEVENDKTKNTQEISDDVDDFLDDNS